MTALDLAGSEFLDIACRGVDIRFHVGNGRLRVWAERFAEIEPELLDLIDSLPHGTVFYDIGASIGLFSLYAAIKRACRIVAFEAEAQNYATLELNHFINRHRLSGQFTALNIALADVAGLGAIHTHTYGAGEHGKVLDQAMAQDTKEAFEPVHVQAVLKQTLDEVIAVCALPPPEVLKVDVDGAEAAVLRGAAATLDLPSLHTVFIELSELSTTDETTILQCHGFRRISQTPVVRLRGGHYPGLFNCVFRR